MSQIILKKSSLFTLDNIPSAVLSLVINVSDYNLLNNHIGDTVLSFHEWDCQNARNLLYRANNAIRFTTSGANIYVCDIDRNAPVNPEPATPTRAPAPIWPPEPITTPHGTAIRQLEHIFEEIDNEPEDEDVEVANNLVLVTGHRPPTELTGDMAIAEIAKCLRNNLSSNATMITSKLNELDKIIKRSFILQNEIEILMKPVVENERIRMIQEQIETINSSGGDIRKAYMTNEGYFVILTNRLESYPLRINGHNVIFDIGEMQITISMAMLLAQTDPGSVSALKIKNLTREYMEEGIRWQCGHVKDNMICLGAVFNQVYQALVEKNIVLAVECILRFIENPDPDDAWGCKILHFPHIEEANA